MIARSAVLSTAGTSVLHALQVVRKYQERALHAAYSGVLPEQPHQSSSGQLSITVHTPLSALLAVVCSVKWHLCAAATIGRSCPQLDFRCHACAAAFMTHLIACKSSVGLICELMDGGMIVVHHVQRPQMVWPSWLRVPKQCSHPAALPLSGIAHRFQLAVTVQHHVTHVLQMTWRI